MVWFECVAAPKVFFTYTLTFPLVNTFEYERGGKKLYYSKIRM